MIDRTIAPAFLQVDDITLIRASETTLDNGLKTFVINAGEQKLVRVELVFNNVAWNPERPLQAYATNSMLNEGTSKLSAAQIAERIDYYGAFLQTDYNYDHSTVTLYTLTKHLSATLPFIKAILTDSIFPESELETFKQNNQQKLSVDLEKNAFVAKRKFQHALFGNSIYGSEVEAEDYAKLGKAELSEYYSKAYQPGNCTIIVSGNVDDQVIKLLNENFGKDWQNNEKALPNIDQFSAGKGGLHYVEKADALQSAIRLGQISINRNHSDFPGLQVLNTVLGGYFGSRLMANIREDKGYTYGIGSAVASLKNAGYFVIASEVGAEVCGAAVNEIEKEVLLLQNEIVTEEELSRVQNYMLGSLLGDLENAFSHADKFKNIYFFGLGYDYYDQYIQTVKTINPDQLLKLAQTYLNFNSFEKVIVGKK